MWRTVRRGLRLARGSARALFGRGRTRFRRGPCRRERDCGSRGRCFRGSAHQLGAKAPPQRRPLASVRRSPSDQRDRRSQRRVRREHAMKSRRCTRGGGTSAANRAMECNDSSTMCVVPSRYGVLQPIPNLSLRPDIEALHRHRRHVGSRCRTQSSPPDAGGPLDGLIRHSIT